MVQPACIKSKGDRVVIMIDWIVDSVEKARAAMKNVKNIII